MTRPPPARPKCPPLAGTVFCWTYSRPTGTIEAAFLAIHWIEHLGLRSALRRGPSMRSQRFPLVLALVFVLANVRSAQAGMPIPLRLSDMAGFRLQSISFFLMGFLLSSTVIFFLWNSLAKDFPRLPRLTFFKACGLVFLWGLLFVVVLTMISGARELMTPGAWKPNGATYKLRDTDADTNGDTAAGMRRVEERHTLATRHERLLHLGELLRRYAREHGGAFPASRAKSGIDDKTSHLSESSGLPDAYIPGRDVAQSALLAYEPLFQDGEIVLLTSGEVRAVTHQQLRDMLSDAKR
jgi:hypothetical protein